MAYARLGDLLTRAGVISEAQLQQALGLQKGSGKRLGEVLIDSGIISEMQLIDALRMQLGVDFVDLSDYTIDAEMANVLPKTLARKYQMVPLKVKGNDCYLCMVDPLNFIAVEEAKSATKKRIIPVISTRDSVDHAIASLYGTERARRAIEDMQKESVDETAAILGSGVTVVGDEDSAAAPAIRLVNSIIERAISEGASDVHLEPREDQMEVRMRFDGVLHNVLSIPREQQEALVARLKIMGNMDITERRVPQDGRAVVRMKMRDVDLRVSTMPTVHGEKVVLRILDRNAQTFTPEGIGLRDDNLKKYDRLMKNRQGVILVVGPTGSGKSSTLYTMLSQLNTEEVNLVTLEDPVEYDMDGVNQIPINEKVGMTFASGLRAILRQDPDIICVGEIRDNETADIAMRAAITGHLVLSTIHTNDAVSTLDRLTDIGVEPFMVSTAVKGIISQRLVRRVCPMCGKPYHPTTEELEMIGMTDKDPKDVKFFHGEGCPACGGTGYHGRVAVFEILVLTREIRRAFHEGVSRDKLLKIIKESGFVSLLENCQQLVLDGTTTVEEAYRIVNVDD